MAPGRRQGQQRPEPETQTLADVLYPDKGKAQVPEKDWVVLVQSIAAGDQGALQSLYAQTNRMVFTLIMRIVGSRESAEELTLDVFHDVWRRSPTYDPAGGSVVGWIMNQARSRAVDRFRFEHRKKRVARPVEGVAAVAAATGPHEALDTSEKEQLLRSALQVLTADERQAIETAFLAELTYREAAAKLDQPLGTVKTRIRSGLAKLRQALEGSGR